MLPPLSRALVPAADAHLLALPEKAVQFGTGAFLRGFVDYFVDVANRAGRFGGRVVAVGSTGSGRDRVLEAQDGLYTLVVQGRAGGQVVEEHRVIASVSRALSAQDEWEAVLAVARSPELELVLSNTTEVGIALDESDAYDAVPPRSFPGKLTRFLHERALAFDHDPSKGVVVIPCELIEDNGPRLKAIVVALAERWALGARFIDWLDAAVPFCSTLVDRIVPGAPAAAEAERLAEALGYRDALLTTCEPYRLFAIQGDPSLRPGQARLLDELAESDPGIVVTDDVGPYRERKVRLLNGTHTAMVPAALLMGCETVREAVEHPLVGAFVRRILFDEIVPTLDAPGSDAFARDVLDRFANPFIRHALFDITLQATMKTRVRLVPTIRRYVDRAGHPPPGLAFGFAAYLLFLRGDLQARRAAAGLSVPADDQAGRIRAAWTDIIPGGGDVPPADADASVSAALVERVLSDTTLWDADLAQVPGFGVSVTASLLSMLRDGVPAALDALVRADPRMRGGHGPLSARG